MKKGKLIKTENGYMFKSEIPLDGYDMACYPWDHTKLRLSLENCEEIEYNFLNKINNIFNGYDGQVNDFTISAIKHAIKLYGNYTREDMKKAYLLGCEKKLSHQYHMGIEMKSLLDQTEWDVEIEIEPHLDRNNLINDGKTHILDVQYRPKMDKNNCLILNKT